MQPLAAKGPFLACWLIASLANGGSPEYSTVTDACKAGVTTTVFVTLTSVHHESTVSISDSAKVETTTITVAPVQSHAKTETGTVAPNPSGASSSISGPVHGQATGSSSSGNTVPASDISSAEYSSVPHTSITLVSTRTVTLTLVPATKGIPLTSGTVVSGIKGTTLSSSGGTSASLISDCITHTVVGPDGRTTIEESTFITSGTLGSTAAEGSSVLATADSPVTASVTAPGPPVFSPSNTIISGLPIHTSFTVTGPDGAVSVIDTTWIIPVPPTSSMSGLGPFPTRPASSGQVVSGISSNPITQSPTGASLTSVIGTTACTTLTVVGPDGKATVSEVTIISPTEAPTATMSNLAPPPFVTPASVTDLAIHPVTSNSIVTTITWTVTGADGTVSGVVETITAPPIVISGMPTHLPSAVTVNISQPPAEEGSKTIPVIPDYVSTAAPVGPSASDASSFVSGIGIGSKPPFVPLPSHISSTLIDAPPAYTLEPAPGTPSGSSSDSASGTQSGSSSSGDWVSSILYGSLPLPSTVTPLPATPVLVTPVPLPVTPAPESPVPVEPLPTPIQPTASQPVTLLTTTTWTNIIPESTTTYVLKFPVTTMATVTVPQGPGLRKRLLKRQSSVETLFPWSNSSSTTPTSTPAPFTENTSLISSLSSQLVTTITTLSAPTTIIPTVSLNTPASTSVLPPTSVLPSTIVPSNTLCPSSAKVGNQTINFDNLRPGPLLNPAADLWFSEGFLVAPPSSPPSGAFLPSSGTQLVEFLPPALVPGIPFDGTGDVAEISVGPNEVTPCFRFNFYGASLGCAAEGVEQWCEFEFSAYTYNETSKSEASLSWSETKRIPVCPQFPQGPCPLTPIQLEGYNNIASILVTVRVGLELRAWWGDDFQIGWSDNSCEAATCRSNAIPHLVKREAFSRASRRGVWQWAPNGVKKLDDDYVWSSFDY
ncbi:hypothetical protein NQ176_g3552 [Zarea fungicola]|uniref:Uncharacterized protein n=1 Tax=Zarea fungicola TaxID=93591 RepID=A0ACC1NKH4_9HYPO|nr:hypothetical protein NQ176_g3552 [Lecanicillium fungicola]